MPKRRRKNTESPSISPQSRQIRNSSDSEWTPRHRWVVSQQETYRRISTRRHQQTLLDSTPRAASEDSLTDPAGFFSNDCDGSCDDVLPRKAPSPQLLENQSTIEKIHVGVDFGTVNSGVAYDLQWKGQNLPPRPGKDVIVAHIRPVGFSNSSYVKTQIGWHSETLKTLYGDEVDDAIRRGKLLRGSHVRGLKLTILDPSGKKETERALLEGKIKALRRTVRLVKHDSECYRRLSKLTPEDLVSEFIGFLVRRCLYRICEARGNAGLPMPTWNHQTTLRNLDSGIVTKVVVYIAVPSLSTAEFVDLIVAATQRAGFPDVVVAPEPACAQQLLLQREFETSRERKGTPYHGASIILDVGGGTADLQTLSIVKYNPIELKEEVLGDGGFYGGHYVNSLFREHAEQTIGNQMDWLVSQLCYPGYDVSKSEILDHLEAKFEEAKLHFDPHEDQEYDDLLLPGQPRYLNRPDRGLVGSVFRLSRDVSKRIFTKQAEELIKLIDNQIRFFRDRIMRIILVGGCSRSAFLLYYLKDHYETNQAANYRITVEAPEDDTSLTIAIGVLLAGFDENFMSEKYLRRSYGTIWERAVNQLRDPKTPHVEKYCPYDAVLIAPDMSKFLLKSGQRVKRQFSTALSGNGDTSQAGRAWRAIPLQRKRPDVKLTETIIFSDHVNEDDLWIAEPSHKISTIEIRLTPEDCQAFEIRQHPTKRKRYYYYVEYEVIIHGDGMRMLYEFLIPRTGKFQDGSPGENPIRKTSTLTLASAFAFYTSAEGLL